MVMVTLRPEGSIVGMTILALLGLIVYPSTLSSHIMSSE
jgi:hypothetical protein